jgi:hypothetical protein
MEDFNTETDKGIEKETDVYTTQVQPEPGRIKNTSGSVTQTEGENSLDVVINFKVFIVNTRGMTNDQIKRKYSSSLFTSALQEFEQQLTELLTED